LAIVKLADIRYAYPPLAHGLESAAVLLGVDLCIEKGELVALMGRTGAGKSTLCMCLNGVVPQSTGGRLDGDIAVLGHDPRRTPTSQLARDVALVYQDADSQLFMPTVEEEVAFGPENLGLPRSEVADRVAWALDVVGMVAMRHRPPSQLSGGQIKRVALAANLAMLPRLLVLDEPFAGLDPAGRRQITETILRIRTEQDMTVLIASADAELVAETADRVAVLHRGRIVLDDVPKAVFAQADIVAQARVGRPAVAELASHLNQRLGTSYAWITSHQAQQDLERLLTAERPT
jgi:energy-coupling factor transport system ATP-binding protein